MADFTPEDSTVAENPAICFQHPAGEPPRKQERSQFQTPHTSRKNDSGASTHGHYRSVLRKKIIPDFSGMIQT